MPEFYEVKAKGDKKGELWLFGYIGNSEWDDITPKKIQQSLKDLGDVTEIDVHITSEGGGVFAGAAIYSYLVNHKAKIIVYVDGLAASMASVIAMAGDEIYMSENAWMMIHNPWGGNWGDAESMRKYADLLDKIKETIINAYEKQTGLDREELSTLMDEETWLNSSDALEKGFITKVMEPVEMAACLNGLKLDEFKNAPLSLTMSASTGTTTEVGKMPDRVASQSANTADNQETKETQNTNNIDLEAVKAEAAANALKAESTRQNDIRDAFEPFKGNHQELLDECLKDPKMSVDAARSKLLNALGSGTEPTGRETRITMIQDQREKFVTGFSNAIMARANLGADDTRNEFRSYTLLEAARMSLQLAGVNTGSMDKLQLVAAAFTHSTSDFTNILENIANKAMMKGYEEAEETFKIWTSKGILTDFKPTKRVDLNMFPSLLEVPEGAEFKHGKIGDRGEQTQLATYGRLFSITRQAIINDDLEAFSKIPRRMGRAAIRTVGDLVYAVLTSNPTMADGNALFNEANHSNHETTGTAIATASVDAMRVKMATQKDRDAVATALNLRMAYLICPVSKEGLSKQVQESETEIAASQNNSKRPNFVRNTFETVSDARLTGTAWYGAASPNVTDTIEVSYLDGVETPYLEQQKGWTVDGTEFKVRIDAAVKALAWEGLQKNDGA